MASINHKFQNFDWDNGFYTRNAILHTEYRPEVIFIGTFNHGWDWNYADFFYGRDMYMWPILGNLFIHNRNYLIAPRNAGNNNPTLEEIFKICHLSKITFADIVSGTKAEVSTNIKDRSVMINSFFKWNNYSDKHLNLMGKNDWLDDNVHEISAYINNTKSIKHVYFTFKSEEWLMDKRDAIIKNINVESAGSIFTPTGMGFRKNLDGFKNRAASLAHCWVWNGLTHKTYVEKRGYIHLDHGWLESNGVNTQNF